MILGHFRQTRQSILILILKYVQYGNLGIYSIFVGDFLGEYCGVKGYCGWRKVKSGGLVSGTGTLAVRINCISLL